MLALQLLAHQDAITPHHDIATNNVPRFIWKCQSVQPRSAQLFTFRCFFLWGLRIWISVACHQLISWVLPCHSFRWVESVGVDAPGSRQRQGWSRNLEVMPTVRRQQSILVHYHVLWIDGIVDMIPWNDIRNERKWYWKSEDCSSTSCPAW